MCTFSIKADGKLSSIHCTQRHSMVDPWSLHLASWKDRLSHEEEVKKEQNGRGKEEEKKIDHFFLSLNFLPRFSGAVSKPGFFAFFSWVRISLKLIFLLLLSIKSMLFSLLDEDRAIKWFKFSQNCLVKKVSLYCYSCFGSSCFQF